MSWSVSITLWIRGHISSKVRIITLSILYLSPSLDSTPRIPSSLFVSLYRLYSTSVRFMCLSRNVSCIGIVLYRHRSMRDGYHGKRSTRSRSVYERSNYIAAVMTPFIFVRHKSRAARRNMRN